MEWYDIFNEFIRSKSVYTINFKGDLYIYFSATFQLVISHANILLGHSVSNLHFMLIFCKDDSSILIPN